MEDDLRQAAAKRISAVVFAVLLAGLMTFCFAGCKYSDVLTEHIEDPTAEVDETQEAIYEEQEGAPEDPDRNKSYSSETDTIDRQERTQADDLQEEAQDDSATAQREHGDDSDSDATKGTDDSEKGQGSKTSTKDEDSSGGNESTELTSDEAPDSGSDSTSGGGGSTEIVDPNAPAEETPTGTIAATGEYATIVQMLGGEGALVAADETWIATVQSQGVFPDETEAVQVGWSGDGTQSGSCDVDAIIDLAPSVVLYNDSDAPLSDGERQKLENAGIKCTVMPDLDNATTTDEQVTMAVEAVGQILSTATGIQLNAGTQASSYREYHDGVLQACKAANGGKYSYKTVGGNTSDKGIYQASNPLAIKESEGTGESIATAYIDSWLSSVNSPVTPNRTYRDVASIGTTFTSMNSSGGVGMSVGVSGSYVTLDYYLQMAGVSDVAYPSSKPTGKGYVMPGWTKGSPNLSNVAESSIGTIWSGLWFPISDPDVAANWKLVGTTAFPAVIVKDKDIAGALQASAKISNGLYNVGSNYYAYVVPEGVSGTWAYGNVESFYASAWALSLLKGNKTVLEAGDYSIYNFYKVFYRCDASKSVVSGALFDEECFYTIKSG